ncbi:transposase [Micromonosporaceae bacterium DT194]|uniref:transposase n=1 Tax=Melissospora conviva TaxID=3388432 RepID=UPI003C184C63
MRKGSLSVWLAGRTTAAATTPRAVAVDGKTLRGSRTHGTTARHVMTACDQATGVVLAGIDIDGKTNEITRFAPLLNQISDLRDTVITADALHCQRDHTTYLAAADAGWTSRNASPPKPSTPLPTCCAPGETGVPGRLDPRLRVDREQNPLGARRHLRRRPLPNTHRHRTSGYGRPTQRRPSEPYAWPGSPTSPPPTDTTPRDSARLLALLGLTYRLCRGPGAH